MPTSLEQDVAKLFTMREAVAWIDSHKEEFKLARPPRQDTLKAACMDGRLKAVLKGDAYITRERELRDYLSHFDPKNKSLSRPVKSKRRKGKAALAAEAEGAALANQHAQPEAEGGASES